MVLQLPIGAESDFHGIVDLVRMHGDYLEGRVAGRRVRPRPDSGRPRRAGGRVPARAAGDGGRAGRGGAGGLPGGGRAGLETLLRCIRAGAVTGTFVPVTCGSAFKNKGVQPLLDAVVDFLPSPLDVPPVKGVKPGTDEEMIRRSADDEKFSALAFKIMNDPFVGTLTFVRIYSGIVQTGEQVLNTIKEKQERIGRMLLMHANSREDIKECRAGDIVALPGLKQTTTGDTLCDPKHPIILERMEFPDPVIEVAVEPKTKGDQEKMGVALSRLANEDPSFRVASDPESGQTVIKGMGELHLEIIVDRMRREFKVDANVGAPQVAYRETISRTAEIDYTHKKQTGGAGQFARVKIRFEPLAPGSGFQFESAIVGGSVPQEYVPGVQKGLAIRPHHRRHRRFPDDRLQGDADRRRLPRRRLPRCWRSRSRRAPLSAKACRRPRRSCSSR